MRPILPDMWSLQSQFLGLSDQGLALLCEGNRLQLWAPREQRLVGARQYPADRLDLVELGGRKRAIAAVDYLEDTTLSPSLAETIAFMMTGVERARPARVRFFDLEEEALLADYAMFYPFQGLLSPDLTRLAWLEHDDRGFTWVCLGPPQATESRRLFRYADHRDHQPLRELQFHPNGNWLAVIDRDRLSIWDVLRGRLAFRQKGRFLWCDFHPHEPVLATAGQRGLQIWEMPSPRWWGAASLRLLGSPSQESSPVQIKYAADGRLLALAPEGTVSWLRLDRGGRVAQHGTLGSIENSPELLRANLHVGGNWVACNAYWAGKSRQPLRLWSLEDGQAVPPATILDKLVVTDLSFPDQGEALLCHSAEGQWAWSWHDGGLRRLTEVAPMGPSTSPDGLWCYFMGDHDGEIREQTSGRRALATGCGPHQWSKDSRYLIVSSEITEIYRLGLDGWEVHPAFAEVELSEADFSGQGGLLVDYCRSDGRVQLFDLASGELRLQENIGKEGCAATDSEDRWLILSDAQAGTLRLYDLHDSPPAPLESSFVFPTGPWRMAARLSHTGRHLAVWKSERDLALIDLKECSLRHLKTSAAVASVAFHPTEPILALSLGYPNCQLSFWDLRRGSAVANLDLLKSGEWLLCSQEGCLDASPSLFERIYLEEDGRLQPFRADASSYREGLWRQWLNQIPKRP